MKDGIGRKGEVTKLCDWLKGSVMTNGMIDRTRDRSRSFFPSLASPISILVSLMRHRLILARLAISRFKRVAVRIGNIYDIFSSVYSEDKSICIWYTRVYFIHEAKYLAVTNIMACFVRFAMSISHVQ